MIYFIRQKRTDLVKIGYTLNDPPARLSSLQVGSPEPLEMIGTVPGSVADEAVLHQQFAASRVRGEWFRATPVMGRLIALGDGVFRMMAAWSPDILKLPGDLISSPWVARRCFNPVFVAAIVDGFHLWKACEGVVEGRYPETPLRFVSSGKQPRPDGFFDTVDTLNDHVESLLRPLLHSCVEGCPCRPRHK